MTIAPVETLDVSVLVPAKDEAANLPEFLQRCAEALGPSRFSFEVIVVNDGSINSPASTQTVSVSAVNDAPQHTTPAA